MVWQHIRTGNKYELLDRPLVRTEEGKWVPGVYYRSSVDKKTYVRTEEEFVKGFSKVSEVYPYY